MPKNAPPAGQGSKGQTATLSDGPSGSSTDTGAAPNTASLAASLNQDGSLTTGTSQDLGGVHESPANGADSTASTAMAGELHGDEIGADDQRAALPAALIQCLEVRARTDGFRRAGRAWSCRPTMVRCDELTDEQIEQLARDPDLMVTGHEIEESVLRFYLSEQP